MKTWPELSEGCPLRVLGKDLICLILIDKPDHRCSEKGCPIWHFVKQIIEVENNEKP